MSTDTGMQRDSRVSLNENAAPVLVLVVPVKCVYVSSFKSVKEAPLTHEQLVEERVGLITELERMDRVQSESRRTQDRAFDEIRQERDALREERDALREERDGLRQEVAQLREELVQLRKDFEELRLR